MEFRRFTDEGTPETVSKSRKKSIIIAITITAALITIGIVVTLALILTSPKCPGLLSYVVGSKECRRCPNGEIAEYRNQAGLCNNPHHKYDSSFGCCATCPGGNLPSEICISDQDCNTPEYFCYNGSCCKTYRDVFGIPTEPDPTTKCPSGFSGEVPCLNNTYCDKFQYCAPSGYCCSVCPGTKKVPTYRNKLGSCEENNRVSTEYYGCCPPWPKCLDELDASGLCNTHSDCNIISYCTEGGYCCNRCYDTDNSIPEVPTEDKRCDSLNLEYSFGRCCPLN